MVPKNSKIINYFIKNGNKHRSENLILKTVKLLQKTTKKNYVELFKSAIVQNSIIIKVRKIKVRKRRFKTIPFLLQKNYRIFYSIKLLKTFMNKSIKRPAAERLKDEIINSSKALNKQVCVDIQKEAFSKKKFAHYRWWS